MEYYGVKIGDKFRQGKYLTSEVVDFYVVQSATTEKLVKILCIAKGIDTMATNEFEVPFATVQRNKIAN